MFKKQSLDHAYFPAATFLELAQPKLSLMAKW